LGALSVLSSGALAVGILAIAFPPILPITLAAAVVITAVIATTLAVSVGLFAQKVQPQRPCVGPKLNEPLDPINDEIEEVLAEDQHVPLGGPVA
jgi:hypothetical protein